MEKPPNPVAGTFVIEDSKFSWIYNGNEWVKMSTQSTTLWSFEYFYHMDKANACMHLAPVKFSPITFHLALALMEEWPQDEDITQELAEVRDHIGKYELDQGR